MTDQKSKSFNLKILKINETLFDNEVSRVSLPGVGGEITVLVDHEPLVTLLKSGEIVAIGSDNKEEKFEIERGYFEVNDNQVSVLLS